MLRLAGEGHTLALGEHPAPDRIAIRTPGRRSPRTSACLGASRCLREVTGRRRRVNCV
jgi:hypothetical protein